jgi:hypothetical protein
LGARDAVERMELPPLVAPGGDGVPPAAAAGGAVPGEAELLARLTAGIEGQQRSPALNMLLVRLIGGGGLLRSDSVEALGQRSALLYRAGLVREADALVTGNGREPSEGPAGLALRALRLRLALAVGDRERICTGAIGLVQAVSALPSSIRGEAIAAQGLCGAAAGNPGAAGLAASLGREHSAPPATLAALEAVANAEPVLFVGSGRLGVIDWRLAEIGGKVDGARVPLSRFEPAALVAVARSPVATGQLKITAAEAATRINALDASALAQAYREQSFSAADMGLPHSARVETWARRALLFKAAEAERTPVARARLIRALLDDARRAGLFTAVAVAVSRVAESIRPVPEIGWFAETAVEVMLAAGRFEDARRWAQFGTQPGVTADRASASLSHWLALIDIADPASRSGRGESLASVEEIALRGRFSAEGLHRLATVLDALDWHVPMRLWEAASRAPQPTAGHLPPTGVLAELQDAIRRRDQARTVTLVFDVLGPAGPEGAHMIALGDGLRALRRVGLEAEARQIASEALFALWPRASSS